MADCIKGIRIKRALTRVKQAKLNAYRKSLGFQEIRHCSFGLIWKIICHRVFFCLQWKVKGTKFTALEIIFVDGTLANKIAKSIIGFSCGLGFTYILQFMLKDQFNMIPSRVLYISIPTGTFLAFGLAFSQSVRFICLLIAPQIFTQQIRIVILGFALSLALSGPGKNYIYNMEILTTSLRCSMDMFNGAFADLVKIIKDPLSVIARFFKILKTDIERIFSDMKETFVILKKVIVDAANVVKEGFRWLKGITEMCNNDFGTPYQRCKIEFKEAVVDCVKQLDPVSLSFMCHVDVLDDLCELTKIVDFLCILPNLMKENIIQPIENEMNKMLDSVKEFFDVSIHTTYNLDIDLNSSKSARAILHDMKEEIVQELDWILKFFNNSNVIVAITFGLVTLLSTVSYRYWYLHLDRHDNIYVTRGMIKMDLERERLGKEIIFPLKFNEAQLYGQVHTLKILKGEGKYFVRKLLLVTLSSVPVLSYICLDLGLYLLLLLIQKYGAIVTDLKGSIGWINVTGEGFMADIDRAILKALKPLHDALPVLDNRKCLPSPREPNYWRYALIIFLLLLCLFLVCTEAYGLRLRHVICGMYHPDRQLYRDRWLYVHILSSRGSWLSYARSQVMAKLTGDNKLFRVSLRDRLIHTCPCGRKLFWFLETTQKHCFLCGRSGDMDDYVNFHHCPTCTSVYCSSCFQDVTKKCPVCMSTMEFDESIDEESGSNSEEDEENENTENILQPLLKYDRKK